LALKLFGQIHAKLKKEEKKDMEEKSEIE